MNLETSLDETTKKRGRELLDDLSTGGFSQLFSPDEQLLNWVVDRPGLKTSLFRLVDVLPELEDPGDVIDHLRAYLQQADHGGDLPQWIQWGLRSSEYGFVPDRAIARGAHWSVQQLASRFIAGSTLEELHAEVKKLETNGYAVSIDRLGEAVVADAEAEAYQRAYIGILESFDELPGTTVARQRRRSLSVKLTALDSQFDSLAREATLDRLEDRVTPILREAKRRNIIVYFDMEQDSTREITLELTRRLLNNDTFGAWENLGVVIQAYHRHSREDCRELIEWCEENDRRLWVRLVKGAYWDFERLRAYRNNWEVPVFEAKSKTDENYEYLARMLGEHYPVVKPAFGSHNLRSLVYGVSVADYFDIPRDDWELQMLYGMGEPVRELMHEQGHPIRLYVPYGDLLPGMAYLVRRLLENTSNQSFLRRTFHEADSGNDPMASPNPDQEPAPAPRREGYRSVGPQNFDRREVVTQQRSALRDVYRKLGMDYPLLVDGEWRQGDGWVESFNPSRTDDLIGRVARAGEQHLDRALDRARGVFDRWRSVGPSDRADWLKDFGRRLEDDRRELAAWIVFENGKNWREADADVMEAIDFCYYYADRMRRLGEGRQWNWPGERNDYRYEPRGPAAVIPPWNFPLAILTGMTTAALVTGNPVLLKPSSNTPVIAYQFVKRALEAGLPEGVLQLVPGSGSTVGARLVEDPRINIVAFTGSRAVGLNIHDEAATVEAGEDVIKKTVLEMGGKNAIIVDRDANRDEAIEGIVQSAFGYQGQKCSACSRVLLPDSMAGEFGERLARAASSLRIGSASKPENFIGPVIDDDAVQRIQHYQRQARQEGDVLLEPRVPESAPSGHYVGPMVVDRIDPSSALAREEIFGPVLPIIRYSTLEEALEIANDVPYALTGGFYSRHPGHIERVKKEFRVGNLYVNQKITGATVGRQPFGGFKLSGTGTKAGGPDYLKNFLWPRSVAENTIRRGFSPEEHL